MIPVLGMSVGASAVRFACRDAERLDGPTFRSRPVTATLERPNEPAAESIEMMLAETDEIDEVQAIGVAYRNDAQADAVQAAMARLKIGNFTLVPEVTAALQMLEVSGDLGDTETLVFYDLGSSGLTVTVVDRTTAMVLSTARSDQISGDLVDRLIVDHQVELNRFTQPADPAARLDLAARCREAKERLSTSGAVCLPGEGGLLLLSKDSFDSLIDGPVETSARLTREVIRRSGRAPDAAVLIGGGANIPLVKSVMESWLDLPVIVPAQPELVAAEGAALLAEPATGEFTGAVVSPTEVRVPSEDPGISETWETVEISAAQSGRRRRLVLTGGVVAVVAALGLGLGLGTNLLQSSESDAQPAATQQQNAPIPAVRNVVPQQPMTTAATPPAPESAPSVIDEKPVLPAQDEVRTTYQPEAHDPTRAPAGPETQNVAPPLPEPAPLIPGLPQFQLPTLPPPPPIPLPELPRIPGL